MSILQSLSGIAAKLRRTNASDLPAKAASRSRSLLPENQLVYAVGDIHGRDDLLGKLLIKIERDAQNYEGLGKTIIFLGDYVDRGLMSKQVIDRLTSPFLESFSKVFLKGNHEESLLQFLENAHFGQTWKYYGGTETLHSYGINTLASANGAAEFEAVRQAFEHAFPRTHYEFLKRLQTHHEVGECFFVHAGVRPGVPLSEQNEHDLLWIRGEFLDFTGSFGKLIIHGHTPGSAPVIHNNRIGIDTGAYMTNVLTALILHRDGVRTLQTST